MRTYIKYGIVAALLLASNCVSYFLGAHSIIATDAYRVADSILTDED